MRSKHAVLTLLLGAVGLHSASLFWVHDQAGSIDAYAFRSLDCTEYFAIAKNIAEHGAFSQDSAQPLRPDTWRTPGYPLFLALTMLLVGKSPTALVLIQHALAIASILLFFTIASQHMSSRRAFLASLILLLEPYHLFYAFWLLSTTFFTLMLLGTWWFWEKVRVSANLWHYATLGLLCGFLVLIWPGALLVPLFLVAGACLPLFLRTSLHHHIATSPHRIIVLALLTISAAAPSAIWMSRNLLVAGHFALSHQSGIVLAYFKATEVELWRQGRTEDRYLETSLSPDRLHEPHAVWESIDEALCMRLTGQKNFSPRFHARCEKDTQTKFTQLPECRDVRWFNLAQGNKTKWNSFEISHELRAIGLAILQDSLSSAIACGLARIAENLAFPLTLAINPAREAATNRLKSGLLGAIYALLGIAAGAGMVLARKNWPAAYFPAAVILALALTTTPQIDPRFRVPMIPFLAFLALLPFRRAELE